MRLFTLYQNIVEVIAINMKATKTIIDPLQTATTLALISAVKSRPSLYIFDKKQSTQDTDEKRALWNDIATELYGNIFLEMDNVEKISAGLFFFL